MKAKHNVNIIRVYDAETDSYTFIAKVETTIEISCEKDAADACQKMAEEISMAVYEQSNNITKELVEETNTLVDEKEMADAINDVFSQSDTSDDE